MPSCFGNITNPLLEIHRILDQASESSIEVNDLHNILHQPLDISFTEKGTTPKIKENRNKSAIAVNKLSFSYHGSDNVPILSKINLTIKKGESIGIAGASAVERRPLFISS